VKGWYLADLHDENLVMTASDHLVIVDGKLAGFTKDPSEATMGQSSERI
jgi:hypothetical protein